MASQPGILIFQEIKCQKCGCNEMYRDAPKTAVEKIYRQRKICTLCRVKHLLIEKCS